MFKNILPLKRWAFILASLDENESAEKLYAYAGERTFPPGQFPPDNSPSQLGQFSPVPLKAQLQNYIYTYMYAHMHTYIHTCIYT